MKHLRIHMVKGRVKAQPGHVNWTWHTHRSRSSSSSVEHDSSTTHLSLSLQPRPAPTRTHARMDRASKRARERSSRPADQRSSQHSMQPARGARARRSVDPARPTRKRTTAAYTSRDPPSPTCSRTAWLTKAARQALEGDSGGSVPATGTRKLVIRRVGKEKR